MSSSAAPPSSAPPRSRSMPGVIEFLVRKNPLTGELGIFSKPEAKSWSLEGSVKLKNYNCYADIWDLSGSYGWDQTIKLSAGLGLPKFKALPAPLSPRVSILSQDWLKVSSYKESLAGVYFGLISTNNHDLTYNLTWRHLTDPSRMASTSVRKQLGHSLLSSIKYTFKKDGRDSLIRPTQGCAFLSSTQVSGVGAGSKSLRFIRQEFDLRAALPLGYFNSALNFGVAAGVIMPWGSDLLNSTSPLPDRFYMGGGNSSLVCTLGGPTSLLGFKARGLGPTEPRRSLPRKSADSDLQASPKWDVLGGDLAVTLFADLSFDLPVELLKEYGIHGHIFASAGNLAKLTEGALKEFGTKKFCSGARASAGFGLIAPIKHFRLEINYCFILRQSEYDLAKTGVQFSFFSSQ